MMRVLDDVAPRPRGLFRSGAEEEGSVDDRSRGFGTESTSGRLGARHDVSIPRAPVGAGSGSDVFGLRHSVLSIATGSRPAPGISRVGPIRERREISGPVSGRSVRQQRRTAPLTASERRTRADKIATDRPDRFDTETIKVQREQFIEHRRGSAGRRTTGGKQ